MDNIDILEAILYGTIWYAFCFNLHRLIDLTLWILKRRGWTGPYRG
jgi:hypothetical protein